tara:strand:+ start:2346 stop:3107 length:762 start_codon:yes stop_codon:yes gene_type:complete
MSQYVTIDEVVRSVLIEEGQYTNHKLLQYTDFAVRTLKELNFDVVQNIRSIELVPHDVNKTRYDLPQDFVNYVKIGICTNGVVAPLGEAPGLCLVESYDDCGYVVSRTPDVSFETPIDTVYWFEGLKNGEFVGKRFGARGGQNSKGYYRVDRENNQLLVDSIAAGSTIIMEYISDGTTADGNMKVHSFAEEALRSGIRHRSLRSKRNIPANEKELSRRDFYNEKRLARARMKSFNKDEAMQMARKGFQSAPKL